eukprot:COSAG04_NODE_730_length_10737_cov_31.931002_14_plen_88_part_00
MLSIAKSQHRPEAFWDVARPSTPLISLSEVEKWWLMRDFSRSMAASCTSARLTTFCARRFLSDSRNLDATVPAGAAHDWSKQAMCSS